LIGKTASVEAAGLWGNDFPQALETKLKPNRRE
jgi:hypothetical protein